MIEVRRKVKMMKYSDENKPIVCMMTHSTCYKGTKKMAVKGVLWHSTGRIIRRSRDMSSRMITPPTGM